MSILIITVNFKAAESTRKFVESASRLDGFESSHIIVVENGSEDDSASRLADLEQVFGNLEVMESPRNRGYFGAAKWALQRYLARERMPDWVIVCNNDVIFNQTEFLSVLRRRNPDQHSVLAPSIITMPSEIDSNPFMLRRPSLFRLARCKFWNAHYYLMWFKQFLSPYVRALRHRLKRQPQVIREPQHIYAPHGAFLIFSRRYFEAGGYIDDGFFLYAEEFSVAEICRRLSLPVIHDPELKVWHEAHRVTGRMCNRTTFEYGREGLDYALRTYFLVPNPKKAPHCET